MKTFLTIFVILLLLGVTIFLLMRKPEKVIDDDLFVKPGADSDVDKNDSESHEVDKIEDEEKTKEEKETNDEEETDEVNIPEHCKIKDEIEDIPNKYFYNIHYYESVRGKHLYCIVVSAVIKSKNYRIIAPFSFYPYLNSYTDKVKTKIKSMFDAELTAEEFLKIGCGKGGHLGIRVKSLDD